MQTADVDLLDIDPLGLVEDEPPYRATESASQGRVLEHLRGRHPQQAHAGGFGDALDKLKLGRLAPAGFSVRSSRKLRTDYADVAVAEVDGPDGPQVRVGLITAESGKWDAGFSGEGRKVQLRQQITQKQALVDAAFESDAEDERTIDLEDEISELESELEDLENERTAVVSPEVMSDLRRQLGEAMTLAKANKAKQDATVRALDALDEQRDDLIAEFSDADLEREISRTSGNLHSRRGSIKRLKNDPDTYGWGPEKIAELIESHEGEAAKLEAELAPMLARRKELVPPDALAKLEDLDRQNRALTEDDIDDLITSAEVSAPNGTRIVAQIWGSDDVDEDWVTARLYVLGPGETTDDADNGDDYGRLGGIKGLSKLIAGLEASRSPESLNFSLGVRSMPLSRALEAFAVTSPSQAAQLIMLARALEAKDIIMRGGKSITVNRGKGGKFARKGASDVADALVDAVTADAPDVPTPKPRRGAVAKALASGDPNALDGVSREALRREAKSRGLEPPRGVSEDVLKDMLWDDESSAKRIDPKATHDPGPDVDAARTDLRRQLRSAVAGSNDAYEDLVFEFGAERDQWPSADADMRVRDYLDSKQRADQLRKELADLDKPTPPAQAPKPPVPAQRPVDVLRSAGVGDGDKVREMLNGMSKTQLVEVARELHADAGTVARPKSKDRRETLIDNIFEGTVGFRERAQAIGGWGRDGRKDAAPTVMSGPTFGVNPHKVGWLGDDPGDADSAGSATDRLDALRAELPGDARERVGDILSPMKTRELDAIAEHYGWDFVRGTKAQKRQQLEDMLVGHKLDSRAIMSWRDRRDTPDRAQADAFFARQRDMREKAVSQAAGGEAGLDASQDEKNRKLAAGFARDSEKISRRARPQTPSSGMVGTAPAEPVQSELAGLSADNLAQALQNVTAGDEGKVRGALQGMSKSDLAGIAKNIPTVRTRRGATTEQIVEDIVEGTVGFRQRAQAIGGWTR